MSIFEVSPNEIESLSDVDLRNLVGNLCEREVAKHGHSPSSVTYGGHQNAADGGIDVRVNVEKGKIAGFIPRLSTGLQVKAEAMNPAAIKAEMMPNGVLRQSIVDLINTSGSYIIVSSKSNVSDTQLFTRIQAMIQTVVNVSASDQLKLDFYDQRRISTWVNQYASLIIWVKQKTSQSLSGWQPFADWSSSPDPINDEFYIDEMTRIISPKLSDRGNSFGILNGINRMRAKLLSGSGCVRLVGLSGVGKTRLIQALFDARIGDSALDQKMAVYADISDSPDPPVTSMVGILSTLPTSSILIIDNCGIELHNKLAAKMTNQGKVSLVTIEYDISDDEPEGTEVFRLESTSLVAIGKILYKKFPELSDSDLSVITEFSDGNARIAIALASTALKGESLANLGDSKLVGRLFRQNNADDPALLKTAKICALFYSFDGDLDQSDNTELAILASLAGQTIKVFYSNVVELQRRQLVQRRSRWRAFLPHGLATQLAKKGLEELTATEINGEVIQSGIPRLISSFTKRVGALHDLPAAQSLVGSWLRIGGWLGDISNFDASQVSAFENVAPVLPAVTLSSILSFIAQPRSNQQHIDILKLIEILKLIAYDSKYFGDCIKAISSLTELYEEINENSDVGRSFKILFYLKQSGTHASAQQRVDALYNLACTRNIHAVSLVTIGLESMLTTDEFYDDPIHDFGARKRNNGFWPESEDEVIDWYETAIKLCSRLQELPNFYEVARSIFAKNLCFLAQQDLFTNALLELAREFAKVGGWAQGWAPAKSAHHFLLEDGKFEHAALFLQLSTILEPRSLKERIITYVLPEPWSNLDAVDIYSGDINNFEQTENQILEICVEIGQAISQNISFLEEHVDCLLRCSSGRVWDVFQSYASAEIDYRESWKVLKESYLSIPNGKRYDQAMHGFISGLEITSPESVEAILEEVFHTVEMHHLLVGMHVNPKVDSGRVERLIRACSLASIPTISFRSLSVGRACDELDIDTFRQLVFAVARREAGFEVATRIFVAKINQFEFAQPIAETDLKLLGKDLLAQLEFGHNQRDIGRLLGRIVDCCLSEDDYELATSICQKLLDGFIKRTIKYRDEEPLVRALTKKFPTVVLDILLEKDPTISTRGGLLRRSFNQQYNLLSEIEGNMLLKWASITTSRLILLAQSIILWRLPQSSDVSVGKQQEWSPIAISILDRAEDKQEILKVFLKRLVPDTWSGSRADIVESHLPLLTFLESNDNAIVRSWTIEAKQKLTREIGAMREWEANQERIENERFDW